MTAPASRSLRGWCLGLVVAWCVLDANPVHAQLAPPTPASTPTSRELAAQAPEPGGMHAYKRRLEQYVKDRRLDVLHPHFEEQVAALRQGQVADSVVNRMFVMVARADESDVGLFDQWTEAHPESYIGPLARGHFNLHRAWQGRGNKFAQDTRDSEFDEMNRWLPLARRDAQIALQREPRCGLCYALLIRLSMPMGLRKEALVWFNQGLSLDRNSITVPSAYFESLDPRWGGSSDQQESLVQRLTLAGHQQAANRLKAEWMVDRIDHRRWQGRAQIEQGLAAARQSLAVADTYDGRYVEAYALQQLERHAEAADAFSRIVAQYISPVEVFTSRAHSHAQLGRWPEAVRDLRIAYEEFLSPWAFEMLVRLSAGNSGWKLRTRDSEANELCREAALHGLPIAMTCLGGLYYFGTGGVPRDPAQARQWFARAAAAGDAQGMMDLAQMCATGQGGTVDRDQAIQLWLSAASHGHGQAQGKLDSELGLWERVRHIHWPEIEQRASSWLRLALQLLQFVYGRG